MTSAEALAILKHPDGQGYIAWDDNRDIPDVRGETIKLDGDFSEKELLAILAFFRTGPESV